MKIIVLLISVLICLNVQAQFIRVYDLNGRKVFQGKIAQITDTTLQLKNYADKIPIKEIGFIKTKHSFGHNSLVGGIIGAGTIGLSTAVLVSINGSIIFPNASSAALGAGIFGFVSGTIIGTTINLFKRTERIDINGDIVNWKGFVQEVAKKK